MRRLLDLRNVEAFVAVADEGSFTAAARKLDSNQPAISTRIAALESELGTKLVDRGARRSSLTPAGRILLPRARTVLRENDNAFSAMERFLGEPSGELHVGASTVPGSYLLPPVLARLRRELPETTIQLVVQDTRETVAALVDSEVEIAVIGRMVDDEKLELETVGDDDVVLVASTEFVGRLGTAADSADAITEIPLALREPGSATRETVVRHLEGLGVDPARLRVVLEVRGNEALREAAMAGLGAAFVSRLAVRDLLESGRLVELDAVVPPLRRPLVLATRRGRTLSPAAERLAELLIRRADGGE